MTITFLYSFGVLLSLEHRIHSEDCAHNVTVEKLSLYMLYNMKNVIVLHVHEIDSFCYSCYAWIIDSHGVYTCTRI